MLGGLTLSSDSLATAAIFMVPGNTSTFVDPGRLVFDSATLRSIPRDLSIAARLTATFCHASPCANRGRSWVS